MASAGVGMICASAAIECVAANANTVAPASKRKPRRDGRSRFDLLLASLGTISLLPCKSLGLNNAEGFRFSPDCMTDAAPRCHRAAPPDRISMEIHTFLPAESSPVTIVLFSRSQDPSKERAGPPSPGREARKHSMRTRDDIQKTDFGSRSLNTPG